MNRTQFEEPLSHDEVRRVQALYQQRLAKADESRVAPVLQDVAARLGVSEEVARDLLAEVRGRKTASKAAQAWSYWVSPTAGPRWALWSLALAGLLSILLFVGTLAGGIAGRSGSLPPGVTRMDALEIERNRQLAAELERYNDMTWKESPTDAVRGMGESASP